MSTRFKRAYVYQPGMPSDYNINVVVNACKLFRKFRSGRSARSFHRHIFLDDLQERTVRSSRVSSIEVKRRSNPKEIALLGIRRFHQDDIYWPGHCLLRHFPDGDGWVS